MKRREFIKLGLLGAGGYALHNAINPSHGILAHAQETAPLLGDNSIFILIHLSGGVSYNMTPVYHSSYRAKYPTLSFGPTESHPLSSEQGLHPSLTNISSLWSDGDLAVINGVGYPTPNRSHAESTDIWLSGIREESAFSESWLSRLCCQLGNMPMPGATFTGDYSLSTASCGLPLVLPFFDTGLYNFRVEGAFSQRTAYSLEELSTAGGAGTSQVRTALQRRRQLETIMGTATLERYPSVDVAFNGLSSSFSRNCRQIALLLSAQETLGTRFFHLSRGGFDTHSREEERLPESLGDFDLSVGALITALKQSGLWERTVIATMSEFGRGFENTIQGTDHGHIQPLLVMGGGINGGIKTPPPSPEQIDSSQSNYIRDYAVDFRQVYTEIVDAMGASSRTIFPEEFVRNPVGLFSFA